MGVTLLLPAPHFWKRRTVGRAPGRKLWGTSLTPALLSQGGVVEHLNCRVCQCVTTPAPAAPLHNWGCLMCLSSHAQDGKKGESA